MKNLIRKILKEEIDKQQQFLEKVVDHMVEGSTIDHVEEEIRYPFTKFTPLTYKEKRKPYAYIELSSLSTLAGAGLFDSYCEEIFALTEEETKYVWKKWFRIMRDKVLESGKYNDRWWVEGASKKYMQ